MTLSEMIDTVTNSLREHLEQELFDIPIVVKEQLKVYERENIKLRKDNTRLKNKVARYMEIILEQEKALKPPRKVGVAKDEDNLP